MTLKVRKDYFIGMLMFKTLHDCGLSYLLPLLKCTNEYHNYNTRAANNNVLVQNKPNCDYLKHVCSIMEVSYGIRYLHI